MSQRSQQKAGCVQTVYHHQEASASFFFVSFCIFVFCCVRFSRRIPVTLDDDSVNLRSPSPDVDGVSDFPYTSSNLQTDGQPEVDRSFFARPNSPRRTNTIPLSPVTGITFLYIYAAFSCGVFCLFLSGLQTNFPFPQSLQYSHFL